MIGKLKEIIAQSKNIVFFGGAGVSTESNIPDFRSETGLYSAMEEYGFPPETMLSHTFFQSNTETFFKYYKENLIYKNAMPNPAHIALAELEKRGKLAAIVTQNIDGLHQKAGSRKVFELHGSVLHNHCTKCGEYYPLEYIIDKKNAVKADGTSGEIPLCAKCHGIVKPNVVLYEEALEESIIDGAVSAIMKADTLIVGGTSLAVYPAAGLISHFRGKELVLINKSSTQLDCKATVVIKDYIGKVLKEATE